MDITTAIAAMKNTPDYRGRTRSKGVVAADVLAGIKMYPVDYAEQISRQIAEIHPQSGFTARKIRSEIRTLSIKKQAIEKRGGSAEDYDEKIAEKIKQLQGLAKEAQKASETFKKAQGE
jgi:geranylgeranyl pyrophosphate synthase